MRIRRSIIVLPTTLSVRVWPKMNGVWHILILATTLRICSLNLYRLVKNEYDLREWFCIIYFRQGSQWHPNDWVLVVIHLLCDILMRWLIRACRNLMLDFEALVICWSGLFFFLFILLALQLRFWHCLACAYLLDLSWHFVCRQPGIKAAPLHRLEGSVWDERYWR